MSLGLDPRLVHRRNGPRCHFRVKVVRQSLDERALDGSLFGEQRKISGRKELKGENTTRHDAAQVERKEKCSH